MQNLHIGEKISPCPLLEFYISQEQTES